MTSAEPGAKRFLFTDIETTGLDEHEDVILEIAYAFTDENLEVVGTPRSFVIKPEDAQWATIANRLRQVPVVQAMHEKSGLLGAIVTADTDLYDVQRQLEVDIHSTDIRPTGRPEMPVHLAGLSVHFDKKFLEYNGWDLEKMSVHHRIYDLSSVKIQFDLADVHWERVKNENEHRALDDVFESIHQARVFRRMLQEADFS